MYLGLNFADDNFAAAKATKSQLSHCTLIKLLCTLMTKLKTIKGKARLHEYTEFVAIKPNETRWNGNYRMVA